MKKEQRPVTLLVIGIAVALTPLLGIPQFMKNAIVVVAGLAIAWFGYQMKKESRKGNDEAITDEDGPASD